MCHGTTFIDRWSDSCCFLIVFLFWPTLASYFNPLNHSSMVKRIYSLFQPMAFSALMKTVSCLGTKLIYLRLCALIFFGHDLLITKHSTSLISLAFFGGVNMAFHYGSPNHSTTCTLYYANSLWLFCVKCNKEKPRESSYCTLLPVIDLGAKINTL